MKLAVAKPPAAQCSGQGTSQMSQHAVLHVWPIRVVVSSPLIKVAARKIVICAPQTVLKPTALAVLVEPSLLHQPQLPHLAPKMCWCVFQKILFSINCHA